MSSKVLQFTCSFRNVIMLAIIMLAFSGLNAHARPSKVKKSSQLAATFLYPSRIPLAPQVLSRST
jgi:hypothetical protein